MAPLQSSTNVTCCSLLVLLCLIVLPISCVNEDLSGRIIQHAFRLKLVDADGNDISSLITILTKQEYAYSDDQLDSIVLNDQLKRQFTSKWGEDFQLVPPINFHSEVAYLPECKKKMVSRQTNISLVGKSGFVQDFPGLLHSWITAGIDDKVIVMEAVAKTVCIYNTTKNLVEVHGAAQQDYRYIIRSSVDLINLLGKAKTGKTTYRPSMEWVFVQDSKESDASKARHELTASAFNMLSLCTTTLFEIDIYKMDKSYTLPKQTSKTTTDNCFRQREQSNTGIQETHTRSL